MQRKSGFLTFIFACCPGAGQMYLGYMRRGLSLMTLFFGIIFLSAFFSFGLLCVLLPVIWAYAFFDTFHLRSQTYEQMLDNPDKFLVSPEAFFGRDWRRIVAKRHTLFGGLLIFLGIYVLYNTFLRGILWDLYHTLRMTWLGNLLDSMPTLIVAVLIILLGIYLVRGQGFAEADDDDDYTAFRGGDGHGE